MEELRSAVTNNNASLPVFPISPFTWFVWFLLCFGGVPHEYLLLLLLLLLLVVAVVVVVVVVLVVVDDNYKNLVYYLCICDLKRIAEY
jgi:hypothetical protein